MIEPNTAHIISKIADIQLEALRKLRSNPDSISKVYLMKLVEAKNSDIIKAIDHHIYLYEDLQKSPEMINMLTEYQTSICSFILWKMESEWIDINQEGVLGAWSLLINAQKKFHPEYQAIFN